MALHFFCTFLIVIVKILSILNRLVVGVSVRGASRNPIFSEARYLLSIGPFYKAQNLRFEDDIVQFLV
jgi:hypothetical protein